MAEAAPVQIRDRALSRVPRQLLFFFFILLLVLQGLDGRVV